MEKIWPYSMDACQNVVAAEMMEKERSGDCWQEEDGDGVRVGGGMGLGWCGGSSYYV